jgi:hypothetical protein
MGANYMTNRDTPIQPGETAVTAALRVVAGIIGCAVMHTTDGAHTSTSYHFSGRAVDLAARSGPGWDTSELLRIDEEIVRLLPLSMISELIYSGPGNVCVKNGRIVDGMVAYGGAVMSRHHNHVHLAVVGNFTYQGSQEVVKPMTVTNDPNLPDIVGPVQIAVLQNDAGDCTGYLIFSHATGELHAFGPGARFFGRSEVTKLVAT